MGSYFSRPKNDVIQQHSPTNSPSPPIQMLPSPSRSFSSLDSAKAHTRLLKPPTPPRKRPLRGVYSRKTKRRRLNIGLP